MDINKSIRYLFLLLSCRLDKAQNSSWHVLIFVLTNFALLQFHKNSRKKRSNKLNAWYFFMPDGEGKRILYQLKKTKQNKTMRVDGKKRNGPGSSTQIETTEQYYKFI